MLNKKQIQKERIEYAKMIIESLDIDIHYEDSTSIRFYFKDHQIIFYPYNGWYTGKSIKDGRGLRNLVKQLKS